MRHPDPTSGRRLHPPRRGGLHSPRARRGAGALLAVALVAAAVLGPAAGAAEASATGRVAGEVLSWTTRRPVAGARVLIPELGTSAVTDAAGRFAFGRPVPVRGPYRRIAAEVRAPGFGTWTIAGAPVWAGDVLLLHAELRPGRFHDQVLTPSERAARGTASPGPDQAGAPAARPAGAAPTCTGWDDQLTPPPTTRVYYSADGRAEEFGFTFYAVHVLPQEWISSWDADSLAAGAVAVKTYAWWRTGTGHARTSGPGCYDSNDFSDQSFDPTWTTATAEAAVDATMGSVAWQGGEIFVSHYYAGSSSDPCAPVTGTFAGWMSQWGTQTCAQDGLVWPRIVETFYDGVSWHFLHDLLLNPSAESSATYPWRVVDATLSRTPGGTAGTSSWTVNATTCCSLARLSQGRPVVGASSDAYHAAAGLRCPPSSPGPCTVRIKVTAITDAGRRFSRSAPFQVPNDGVWRSFGYDVAAFGVAHSMIRLELQSRRSFSADAVYLSAPYGGP
jgi:Stage II sporulation protein